MRKAHTGHDTAYLLAGRLVSAATTLVLLGIVGHRLGARDLGVVGLGFAAGALLTSATDWGGAVYLIRELSRRFDELDRLYSTMVVLRLANLLVAGAVAMLILGVVFPSSAVVIFLIAAGLAVQNAAELSRAVFISSDRIRVAAIHTALENVVWLIVTGGLILGGQPLSVAFLAAIAVFTTSNLAGLLLARVLAGLSFVLPGRVDIITTLRSMAAYATFQFVSVSLNRADVLLVGALVPQAALVAAGAYFAASRVVIAFEYLPDAVSRALLPRLTREYTRVGLRNSPGVLNAAAQWLSLIGMPIPLALAIGGSDVLALAFGNELRTYGWVLIVVSAAIPFRYISYATGVALTSVGDQLRRARAVSVAAVVVLLSEILLLPTFGVLTAALATVAASVIVATLYMLDVRRRYQGFSLEHAGVVGLTAQLIAGALLLQIRTLIPPTLLALLFLLLYGVLVGSLRALVLRGRAADARRVNRHDEYP